MVGSDDEEDPPCVYCSRSDSSLSDDDFPAKEEWDEWWKVACCCNHCDELTQCSAEDYVGKDDSSKLSKPIGPVYQAETPL